MIRSCPESCFFIEIIKCVWWTFWPAHWWLDRVIINYIQTYPWSDLCDEWDRECTLYCREMSSVLDDGETVMFAADCSVPGSSSADCYWTKSSQHSCIMIEEEEFHEDIVDDVEGCMRDFFLGCIKCHNSDDLEIVDGLLFGQSYQKIKVSEEAAW